MSLPSPSPSARSQIYTCLQIAELKGIPAAIEGSNFVFSPLSLAAALSLTATGARGGTQAELLCFLGSPTLDHLHSSAAQLVQAVRTGDRELILSFVNGAWIDRSMTVNPSFTKAAASVYGAGIESVDFIGQAPFERKKINDWIEEKSKGIIKNLIPDDAVNHSTRLILANALHFKGKWQEKFNNSMTINDKFYLLNETSIQTAFMSSRDEQFISSYNDFKLLMLPYKTEEDSQESRSFSLLLFLPNQISGLRDLIKRVVGDPNFIGEHIPSRRVDVGRFMVPKFKVSFNFEASDVLKQLGLKGVFDPRGADLGGMCSEASGIDRLFVSGVLHKAAIEVDEEGTTAAAATAITVSLMCYTPPVDFVADHPFVFAVREDRTGTILFFGHVVDPSIQ